MKFNDSTITFNSAGITFNDIVSQPVKHIKDWLISNRAVAFTQKDIKPPQFTKTER